MTTYVLAGTMRAATQEAQENIKPTRYNIFHMPIYDDAIVFTPNSKYALEGRNILPGDSVLFGYGTTADMIEQFVMQAATRGTKLSDLRIIHK